MLRTLLALILAIQPVLAADLPDLGEVSRQYFSDQEEQALGRTIMRDVYADPRYLDDPEIENYLNQLGYKLVSASARNQRTFNFFVVDDPTINAFAMPGGNIGVHTGLLLAAQSESELASVIAHEIAHVTQNHLARMVAAQSQSYWPTMAALALALLASRSNPNVASAAIASTQAYSIQNQLNYSRDYEREADRLGYDTLTRAGFDPHAMSEFFERLQRANRFYDTSARPICAPTRSPATASPTWKRAANRRSITRSRTVSTSSWCVPACAPGRALRTTPCSPHATR